MSAPVSSAAATERLDVLRAVGRRVAALFLLPETPDHEGPQDGWLPPVPEVAAEGASAGLTLSSDARPSAAVLGATQDVPAVAAALANTLASGAPPLVACWSPASELPAQPEGPEPAAPPALPGARRLAAALTADGTPSVGRGRVAWAPLPSAPEEAAAAWTSARDGAGRDRAAVLAVAGPRPVEFDASLAAQDLIVMVVRDGEDDLAALARGSFEAAGATVFTVPPLIGVSRMLALAGLGRLELPLTEPATSVSADPEAQHA